MAIFRVRRSRGQCTVELVSCRESCKKGGIVRQNIEMACT